MTIDEILEQFYNKPREKKREVGKYWASDIYAIRKGYLTASKFLQQKEINEQGGANIFWGSASEKQLDTILQEEHINYKTQERFEISMNDYVLSGKTDFSFPQFILETKCPKESIHHIPEKWMDQLECYHRAFNKPVKLGIFYKNGDKIIKFFSYTPSEQRWAEIKLLLDNFHKKVQQKHGI